MRSIVVKIGSSSVTRVSGPDPLVLTSALDAALNARSHGWNVVLVSSGAASSGSAYLARTSDIHPSRRLAAAVGQPFLMDIYRSVSDISGRHVCQILMSESDLRSRDAVFSVCAVLNECSESGIVAIVNGNDVTDKTGSDNDAVAVAIAVASGADRLLLLTDVPGVHTDFQKSTAHLPSLPAPNIRKVRTSATGTGRGGMRSKLHAAELAAFNGIETHIASAGLPGVITSCILGESVGTCVPSIKAKSEIDVRWISGVAPSCGSIVINRPAEESIQKGASLFASGIKKVYGNFAGGDVVELLAPSGYLIARGLSKISARLMGLIRSMQTNEIAIVLTEILYRFLQGNLGRGQAQPATKKDERLGMRIPVIRALELLESYSYELTRTLALEIMNLFPAATAAAMFEPGGEQGIRQLSDRYARLSSDLSLIDRRHLVVF